VPVYIPKFAGLGSAVDRDNLFWTGRRNPSTGLLLGMVIGLLQDSLSGPTVPLGLYGIAKTILVYLASSIGARLDTEHPAARFAMTMIFFVIHQGFITLTRRLLLAEPIAVVHAAVFIAAAVMQWWPYWCLPCWTTCGNPKAANNLDWYLFSIDGLRFRFPQVVQQGKHQ